MDRADSERLQNDLATLRTLLRFELPFERFDVRGLFVTGATALLPAIVALAGFWDAPFLLASSVPYVTAIGYFLVRNYLGASPGKPCPAAKRREYRVGLPVMLLCIALLMGCVQWAKAAGAPGPVADAYFLLSLGWLLLYQGLYEPGRQATLLVAVPAIAAGLIWPFVPRWVLWIVLWLGIGLGMIAAAALMRWQLSVLRRSETAAAQEGPAHGAD